MVNRACVCLVMCLVTLVVAAGACVPGVSDDSQIFFPPVDEGFSQPPRASRPRPEFGRARASETNPPPVIGGTLAALADRRTAVAADPDRDRIFVVDYVAEKVLADLPLTRGDEPGRVIEDAEGRVHVVLRRAGALLTLAQVPVEPVSTGIAAAWRITGRRPVCAAPRGVAYDPRQRLVHVACAEGELVSLAPEGDGALVRRLGNLDPDLRDVVVDGEFLLVSRFRSADVLTIDSNGAVIARHAPPDRQTHRFSRSRTPSMSGPPRPDHMVPSVGWRLVGFRPGEAVLLHQRALDGEVDAAQGGYGGDGCGVGIVESVASSVGPLAPATPAPTLNASLTVAVDLAVSPDRREMVVVSPANVKTGGLQAFQFATHMLREGGADCTRPTPPRPPGMGGAGGTGGMAPNGGSGGGELPEPIEMRQPTGEATAVSFDLRGHVLVQTREPASIQVLTANKVILLSRESREDTGHAIFHANSGSSMACASCHPEGTQDGRIWKFRDKAGKLEIRRTQDLTGGIAATAPFHWNGDLKDLRALMTEVFETRMNGPVVEPEQLTTLGRWLDAIPAHPTPAPRDPTAVDRGRTLFQSTALACATCHAGPLYTNNTTVDVGTGQALQVPALRGVRWRAPFMHDGCAATLADRFTGTCGGGDRHGATSRLDPREIADLVAYLEAL